MCFLIDKLYFELKDKIFCHVFILICRNIFACFSLLLLYLSENDLLFVNYNIY